MRHLFLFILIFTNACGLKAQKYLYLRCDNDRLSIIDSKKKLQTLSCYTYKVENKTLILKSDGKTYVIRPNVTNKTINQMVDIVSDCACYDANSSYVDAVESNLIDFSNNGYLAKLKANGSNVKYTNYAGTSLSSTFTPSPGLLNLTSIYLPKTISVDSITFFPFQLGVYNANNYNGIGIYEYSQDTFRLIVKTPNDTSLFKRVTATPLTVAFENSVILNKGVYYVGFMYSSLSASTNPTIHVINSTIAGQTNSANFLGDSFFAANGLSSLNAPSSYTLLEPKIPKSHMAYYGAAFPIAFK